MARNMVHGKEYHAAKAKIMKPIEQFHALLKMRIAYEEDHLNRRNQAISFAITILVVATIGFSIYVFFLMRRRIIFPLARLKKGARSIKKGDYSQQIELIAHDEIGELATAFNAMSYSIKENTSRLYAILESITDGILVVDLHQKKTVYNARFLDIWQIDPALAENVDDEVLLNAVLVNFENPGMFLDRVRALYADLEKESFETLNLKDGRILERYSRPQRLGEQVVGRV